MNREEVTFAVEKSYIDSGADKTAMSLYTNGFISGSQWMKNKLTSAQQDNIVAENPTHNTAHSEIASVIDEVYSLKLVLGKKSYKHLDIIGQRLEKIAQQQNV